MNYQLEKFTTDNKEYVISTLGEKKYILLNNPSFLREDAYFLAIDHCNGNYLFIGPKFGPEDGFKIKYYFYFNREMYELEVEDSFFGNDIRFKNAKLPRSNNLNDFELQLLAAAVILGRNGDGVVNDENIYPFKPELKGVI